jgi:hypothetical protein
MQDQELEERREQLAYLASGGREGTLLEEVEGLASGEHDECLVILEEVVNGEEEEEGRKRKVGKWKGKRKEEKRTGKRIHLGAADLPMLGPFWLLTELKDTPSGLKQACAE